MARGIDEQTIKITHGFSKDRRPDLKQVIQELLVSPGWWDSLDDEKLGWKCVRQHYF